MMVLINTVIAFSILAACSFWIYIFPKKNIPLFVQVIILSIFPLFSIWRQGVFESGDFAFHTKVLILFYRSLQDGVLFPSWSADFCGKYGQPHFTYFYKLPYYIGSLFHFFGLSFIDSMKLLFTVVFMGSGISMFALLKKECNEKAALLGAALYLYAPYQLSALHFRHALGEMFGFLLVPLLFISAKTLITNRRLSPKILFVVIYAALILSHHIIPILITPLLIIYVLLQKNIQRKNLLIFGSLVALSFLLTAFHWMPLVFEGHLVYQSTMKQIEFHPFLHFLYSPWRYGFLYQGNMGELSPLIGYAHVVLFIVGMYIFFRKKLGAYQKYMLAYALIVFIGASIMMQSFMEPLWNILPFFSSFQFSTRLLFLTTFSSALIGAIVATIFPSKKLLYIFLFLIIFPTLLNWSNRGMIPNITDAILEAQIPERCDALVIPSGNDPKKFLEITKERDGDYTILSGKATVKILERTSHRHRYSIDAEEDIIFKENTTYFPGWEIRDNNGKASFTYQDPTYPGIIILKIKKGAHIIDMSYKAHGFF